MSKSVLLQDGHHQWQNGDDFLLTLCPEIPLDKDEAAQALIDLIQEHGDWVEVNLERNAQEAKTGSTN